VALNTAAWLHKKDITNCPVRVIMRNRVEIVSTMERGIQEVTLFIIIII